MYTLLTRREIQCLPYAGILRFLCNLCPKIFSFKYQVFNVWRTVDSNFNVTYKISEQGLSHICTKIYYNIRLKQIFFYKFWSKVQGRQRDPSCPGLDLAFWQEIITNKFADRPFKVNKNRPPTNYYSDTFINVWITLKLKLIKQQLPKPSAAQW